MKSKAQLLGQFSGRVSLVGLRSQDLNTQHSSMGIRRWGRKKTGCLCRIVAQTLLHSRTVLSPSLRTSIHASHVEFRKDSDLPSLPSHFVQSSITTKYGRCSRHPIRSTVNMASLLASFFPPFGPPSATFKPTVSAVLVVQLVRSFPPLWRMV